MYRVPTIVDQDLNTGESIANAGKESSVGLIADQDRRCLVLEWPARRIYVDANNTCSVAEVLGAACEVGRP
jgi:hypothetical protein